ncbi:histidine phosphatase family protein [Lactiplantibacillus sp. WILCCON 0030]|uniref:Histidine phosphatase family protein n=1 Tax=Lactiplantibacillus brownii TaxID=3069269 RepID=A0ABU1AAS0_9LACO|nr:histidine phosphatase family protein [Lactiplantibacillus brownii]MDQ7938078.1 histidine phosphatase family protein [Lactiplantibacillus brownii]
MKIYLIRHGEPDYTDVTANHYVGYGRDLGGLTPAGIKMAQRCAQQPELQQVQLILTSPFTRTMATTLEIARQVDVPVKVELGLHEWQPDRTGTLIENKAQVLESYTQYQRTPHQRPANFPYPYETSDEVRARVTAVFDKYAKQYDCIACVTHGEVMHQLTGQAKFDYCEIWPMTYPTT